MEKLKSIRESLPAPPIVTFPPMYTPPAMPDNPDKTPILYIFPKSKKLLTSWDVESLKYQAFLVFSHYRHTTRQCHEQDKSPSGNETGRLPFLVNSAGQALAGRDILSELREKVGDLDARLSDIQRADVLAFTAMIETKLHIALIYYLYYDEKNFNLITLSAHKDLYPWPLNLILAKKLRWDTKSWLLQQRPVVSKEAILADAKATLAALSTQLGGQLYFFGAK
ncbi:Metaxin-3 [Rhizophlyctis rosea]|uniref:Metaxin-3 n=1 Tax=Rhizophlyctis rosea TaxID=64517 RepID=A0AAD5X454_9FUNG|nr:Metaxin-3 [Rhizophlyctis rosea]